MKKLTAQDIEDTLKKYLDLEKRIYSHSTNLARAEEQLESLKGSASQFSVLNAVEVINKSREVNQLMEDHVRNKRDFANLKLVIREYLVDLGNRQLTAVIDGITYTFFFENYNVTHNHAVLDPEAP